MILKDFKNKSKIAVIGGANLSDYAILLSEFISEEIINQGFCLITGGRRGAGEHASYGAYKVCLNKKLKPDEFILSIVPENRLPDFSIGPYFNIGKNKTERSEAIIENSFGAIVIGGGRGTSAEVAFAVIKAIIDGYGIIPIPETGGIASFISKGVTFDFYKKDEATNIIAKKAIQRLIKQGPCWYCNINIYEVHDEFFKFGSNNPRKDVYKRIRNKFFLRKYFFYHKLKYIF